MDLPVQGLKQVAPGFLPIRLQSLGRAIFFRHPPNYERQLR
jgi:hypothetical protein